MTKKKGLDVGSVVETIDDEIDMEDILGVIEDSTDVDDIEVAVDGDVPEGVEVGVDIGSDSTPSGWSAGDPSDIASLITDIDDSVEYLTWLIYGKNGTGKTTLLSTIDGMLVLAAEDGTLSIREKAKGNSKKMRIPNWEALESVYWLLKSGKTITDREGNVLGIKIPVKGGTFVVKSIGFDTLTKLAEICMRSVVDEDGDILNPTLRHHGQVAQRMKYWLEAFDEFPIQKVWLVQETANSDDLDSDEFSIFPALSKSIRTYALSQADVVGRTYIGRTKEGKQQFRISFAPNSKYVTKDRTNKLGAVIANPKLSTLYKRAFDE